MFKEHLVSSEIANGIDRLMIDTAERRKYVFDTVVEMGEVIPGGPFAAPEMIARAHDGMKMDARSTFYALNGGRIPYDQAVVTSTSEQTRRDKFGRLVTTTTTTSEWHPIWIIREDKDYSGRSLANKKACLAIDGNGNPHYLQKNGSGNYSLLGYQSQATADKFFDTHNTPQPELGRIQEEWLHDLASATQRYNKRPRTREFSLKPEITVDVTTEVSDAIERRLKKAGSVAAIGGVALTAGGLTFMLLMGAIHKGDGTAESLGVDASVESHKSLEDQCYDTPNIVPANKTTKEGRTTVIVTGDTTLIKAMSAGQHVIVKQGVHVDTVLACGADVEVQVEGSVDQVVVFGALPVLQVSGSVTNAALYGSGPEAVADRDGYIGQLTFNDESVKPPAVGQVTQ